MRRPLYLRLLRVRHLNPRPWQLLLLTEGPVAVAVVLALAEIVSWWAVLVIPATVAAWVKFSDVVKGEVWARPLAEAQLRRPRPSATSARGVGVVPRPRS